MCIDFRRLFRSKKEPVRDLITQDSRGRYLDDDKLRVVLEELFPKEIYGEAPFTIGMRNDQWLISTPRPLTDEELDRAKP
ncbi:hypothetical protein GQ44DRAFT_717364 [Phaeosphaeriaceae sp. PMI808]|nr:hypothetical protein GQ44DRAFT_717364 [Phaeosphaeriaceae sp. PMI808]